MKPKDSSAKPVVFLFDFLPENIPLTDVHRFLSAILLVCFGLLASQTLPARLCLLENKILRPGVDSCSYTGGGEMKCCGECESHGAEKNDADCCVDLETLPDTTVPSPLEKLPVPALVILSFIESEWLVGSAVTKAEAHPLPPLVRASVSATTRQAVLSIWTV